jgi:hypothetical protein
LALALKPVPPAAYFLVKRHLICKTLYSIFPTSKNQPADFSRLTGQSQAIYTKSLSNGFEFEAAWY